MDSRFAVNGRIEGGVIVHFELAVELEAAHTVEGLLPQSLKTASQIVALFDEDGEPLGIALDVAGWRIGALGFFARVINLQRENRKPIDDESGRLGVEGRGGVGQDRMLILEPSQKSHVQLLGQVVAALVDAVDTTLDGGQLGVAGAGSAGLVFSVPELKVGLMLASNGIKPISESFWLGPGDLMPCAGELVLKFDDRLS